MFNLSQKKNEAFKALKFGTIISVSMFSFPLPPTLNINMMFKHHLNIVFESFILIKKKKSQKKPFYPSQFRHYLFLWGFKTQLHKVI